MPEHRPPLHYPPLARASPGSEEAKIDYPKRVALRNLYAALPFPRTEPGQAGITAAMRGSTAAFYTDNRFRFRHPRSDVDIFVISPRTPRPGVRYYFYTVRHLSPTPREVDVLCFSPKRLQAEHNHPQRIFLTTKLVQPGIPIFHDNDYAQFKLESIAALVRRGLARRGEDRLTPSGAGRLVIEEDLFAEPWRWQSLQTYYLLAPAAPRHRRHLWLFCAQALSWLHKKGLACPVGETTSPYPEPVYAVEPGPPQQGQPHLLRLRTVLRFVYDQLDVLARSGRRSFTLEKATRLALKAASLRHNPRLRYDADVVFTPPGSIAPPGRPAPPL